MVTGLIGGSVGASVVGASVAGASVVGAGVASTGSEPCLSDEHAKSDMHRAADIPAIYFLFIIYYSFRLLIIAQLYYLIIFIANKY
jgi:hypothetical protein